jgi:uncharacterized protein YndB with AHSA1/START domain
MIAQTVNFPGVRPGDLYDAFLVAREHTAMTAPGPLPAIYHRPGLDEVPRGEVGDELRAFAIVGSDGQIRYSVSGTILNLVPRRLIVMSWVNLVWSMAVDAEDTTDLPSTLELRFVENVAGAEIRVVQVGVPDYKVHIPQTGETGPLSQIVNTHWNLLYWDPMRRHFASSTDRTAS